MEMIKTTIPQAETEMPCLKEAKEWLELKNVMTIGDELIKYSDGVVSSGWPSGSEGVALLRKGKVLAKVATSIIG